MSWLQKQREDHFPGNLQHSPLANGHLRRNLLMVPVRAPYRKNKEGKIDIRRKTLHNHESINTA